MDDDLDIDNICTACAGSGEGVVDGSRCTTCKGSGVEPECEDDSYDEPPERDCDFDEPLCFRGR